MTFQIQKKLLVFLDETGDHSLEKIDPEFPIFAIAGVIFEPPDYPDAVSRFNSLKLAYFAHEGIIIHSREIASREGDFVFLNDEGQRKSFLGELSQQIELTNMRVAAGVIQKDALKERYREPFSPYDLAFSFVFEKVFNYACNVSADYIHFIAEARGQKEDHELHDTFEGLKKKDGPNVVRMFPRFINQDKLDAIHVRLEFRKKPNNIIGLQIADLVVSPIARTVLKGIDHPSLQYFRDKFIYGIESSLKKFPS